MKNHIKTGLQFLGEDYTTKIIDFEECIYRDLGKYDIEISYLKRKTLGKKGYKIYLWSKNPLKIIRKFEATPDLVKLKEILDGIVKEYA
ncbi:MAG: hypothetical protein WC364_13525 [Eubacteriales bacterium]